MIMAYPPDNDQFAAAELTNDGNFDPKHRWELLVWLERDKMGRSQNDKDLPRVQSDAPADVTEDQVIDLMLRY